MKQPDEGGRADVDGVERRARAQRAEAPQSRHAENKRRPRVIAAGEQALALLPAAEPRGAELADRPRPHGIAADRAEQKCRRPGG